MNKLTLAKTHDFAGSDEPKLTVVFIHGIASDSSAFSKSIAHFEAMKSLKDVRFITFDLLGSGKSKKSDEFNYDYDEQLSALKNSLEEAKINTPLILVGHSLGTFIVTRFASKYAGMVSKLILISAPVYTKEDLNNPAFPLALKAFEDAVSIKNRDIVKEKSFINSMKNIVLDEKNYDTLSKINLPTTIIYGDIDQIIASYNYPTLKKQNPNIKIHKTVGRHGVSHEKYFLIGEILEKELK